MVIDTSVIIAILSYEPEAEAFAKQVAVARQAYRTYGKGRHPAGLNFDDCFSYALAQVSGEPILFLSSNLSISTAIIYPR